MQKTKHNKTKNTLPAAHYGSRPAEWMMSCEVTQVTGRIHQDPKMAPCRLLPHSQSSPRMEVIKQILQLEAMRNVRGTREIQDAKIVYHLSDPKQISYLIASPKTCQGVKQLSI